MNDINIRKYYFILVIFVDFIVIWLTALISLNVVGQVENFAKIELGEFILYTSLYCSIFVFISALIGLYRLSFHISFERQLLLGGKVYLYSLLVILASFYIINDSAPPRGFTLTFFMILFVTLIVGKHILSLINKILFNKGILLQNVLVYGESEEELEIVNRFNNFPELGYKLKGVIHRNDHFELVQKVNVGSPLKYYDILELPTILDRNDIDIVFISTSKIAKNGFEELINICRDNKIKIKSIYPESEHLIKKSKIVDLAGVTFYDPIYVDKPFGKFIKRSLDLVGSAILLLLLSPILILTSLVILIESGRPVLFKQRRALGKGVKLFNMYKFRTMRSNATQEKKELNGRNTSDGILFKIKDDPRLTRVGKFIRISSIDELPQLFNVIIGNMSLVGPRPLPESDFDSSINIELHEVVKDRGKMLPGMTGLWQISGRSDVGFKEMVLLDLYYNENQSFMYDLEILFETIPVVLFGKGAY